MDPLLSASVLRRAPVHDRLLFPRDTWREQRFYAENARRWGTEHYLVCPILGATSVIGTIHFARSPHHRGFGAAELHMAAVVTAHVSVALSVRATREGLPRLSVRELQVARLAADGMNNVEIAVRLGIARETVKKTLQRAYTRLGVRSRAQLVVVLARAGLV